VPKPKGAANVVTSSSESSPSYPGQTEAGSGRAASAPRTRVLIVDDGAIDLDHLVPRLQRGGFTHLLTETVMQALLLGSRWRPQMAIVGAGVADCARLVRQLRRWKIPILLVGTASQLRSSPDAGVVDGDVVTTAGSIEIVQAAEALVSLNGHEAPSVLQIGRLRIDVAKRLVFLDGKPLRLSPRQFATLVELARHPSETIEHDELARLAWPDDPSATKEDVHRYMYRLRRRLGDHERVPPLIRSRRGFGYFLAQERELNAR
jgi:two-component system KDP operon response regulator KdpE